jgi:hypothetical protein
MLVLLLAALLLNCLVGHFIAEKRGEKYGGKIRDVGFDILPNLSNHEYLTDLTLILPALLVAFNWNTINRDGYIMMLTFMYFARALSNMVTQLPYATDKECKSKPPMGFCNDYIFSGHTTFNIVTSYFLKNGMFPVYPIFSSLITIATRSHYSIDVLIAWIIFFALKCNVKV